MLNLQKKFDKINPLIIATWLDRDCEALHSHLGLNYPTHREDKDKIERKIRDYDDPKEFIALGDQLYALQRYKGIRELLGGIENERLVNFLRKEFHDFTIRELWTAIDLSSAPDNPFGLKYAGRVTDFTNDYLSMVLGPYRTYRAALINKYVEEEIIFSRNKAGENQSTTDISAEEKATRDLNFDYRFCTSIFNSFTEGGPVAGLDRVYDIMEKHALLSFTKERQEHFQTTAKDRMNRLAKTDGRVRSVMQALEKGVPIGVESLDLERKRVAMQVFFIELRDAGLSPKDLFQEKYSAAKQ